MCTINGMTFRAPPCMFKVYCILIFIPYSTGMQTGRWKYF